MNTSYYRVEIDVSPRVRNKVGNIPRDVFLKTEPISSLNKPYAVLTLSGESMIGSTSEPIESRFLLPLNNWNLKIRYI